MQRMVLVSKSLSASSRAYLTEKQEQQFYPRVAQAKARSFSPEAESERKWGYCCRIKAKPSTHTRNHNNMARKCKAQQYTVSGAEIVIIICRLQD